MNVLVTDTGFSADDWTGDFIALTDMAANDCGAVAIDLASDAEPTDLAQCLERIAMIRVDF
ncbi:MAG: oxidoreductase, partial [Octadecabacter sp.]|nr:oxidoreductase [Octadecabacter sp.]